MSIREGTEKGGWDDVRSEKNNLCYWYEAVIEEGVPSPKTVLLRLDQNQGRKWLEGEEKLPEEFKSGLLSAGKVLGYPLFIRTDSASGKHEWSESCYVEKEEDIFKHLSRVLEFNEMADILGLNYCHVAVREYLEPDHKFTAFYGMPVSREYRFFADASDPTKDTVRCSHPYWFPEALEEASHKPELPSNWRELLKETYNEKPPYSLNEYAARMAKRLGGYWSVDFMQHKGQWFLTDMAMGIASYHYPHKGTRKMRSPQ